MINDTSSSYDKYVAYQRKGTQCKDTETRIHIFGYACATLCTHGSANVGVKARNQ